jgi:hypothetical protein
MLWEHGSVESIIRPRMPPIRERLPLPHGHLVRVTNTLDDARWVHAKRVERRQFVKK